MTPETLNRIAITPALSLLPAKMDSPEARAMLIAIALQESRIEHRQQIRGPARGFWQFEKNGGVKGVLTHPASKDYASNVCGTLEYSGSVPEVYDVISDNDVLAAAFARLLLWTLPKPLPKHGEARTAWVQYLDAWRPGKPHLETWDAFYSQAWKVAG